MSDDDTKMLDPESQLNRPRKAHIIAVGSGKGGTGKSITSILLAAKFAQTGQSTLLIDADFGAANIDVYLGLAPDTDLAAVIAGWVEIDDAVTTVELEGTEASFDVLPGRAGSGALAELPAEEVSRMARAFAKISLLYDRVIIDVGGGIEASVMRIARSADALVLVTTNNPAAMTDSYAFIKVMKGYAPNISQHVIINMANSITSATRTYDAIASACQTFLGFRPGYSGSILWNDDIRGATNSQKVASILTSSDKIQEEISEISESL